VWTIVLRITVGNIQICLAKKVILEAIIGATVSDNTGCCRNNSHISKNHCGVPKAGRRVWSVPLGWVHHKVFSRRHAVVG
jgi:hypothetical protein